MCNAMVRKNVSRVVNAINLGAHIFELTVKYDIRCTTIRMHSHANEAWKKTRIVSVSSGL